MKSSDMAIPRCLGAAAALVSLLLPAVSIADAVPGGPVSGTWTLAGSPYLVEGEIEVPAGATLTIEPGVEVRFQGWYKFIIRGCLLAVGTAADSIRFHAENPATGWHSLRFLDTATSDQPASQLRYCRIEHGRAQGVCPDNSGAGIYMGHARAEIRHCLITGNTAPSGAGSWGGGGIALEFTNEATIADCHIVNNSTGGDGGGIYLYWSRPVIENNLISGNQAVRGRAISGLVYSAATICGNVIRDHPGGAIYLSGSAAWLVNNRLENNSGSAVECFLCHPHIIGNLLAGNNASTGGAIRLVGSSPRIINNTIANNTASQGGGLYATFHFVGSIVPSQPTLTNNIVYGNTAGSGAQLLLNTHCSATLDHCNVQDLDTGGMSGTVTLVEGNWDLPPCWAGYGEHPYALAAGSPCRDAGRPDVSGLDLPATDLAGSERIYGGRVDMGAYEFSPAATAPMPRPTAGVALLPAHPNPFNPSVTMVIRLAAPGQARLEILDLKGRVVAIPWDGPAPAGETPVVWAGLDLAVRPAPTGAYLARLTAGAQIRTVKLALVR